MAFEDGNKVRIKRAFEDTESEGFGWLSEMDETVGQIGTIYAVYGSDYGVGFENGKEFGYPEVVLEKVE